MKKAVAKERQLKSLICSNLFIARRFLSLYADEIPSKFAEFIPLCRITFQVMFFIDLR